MTSLIETETGGSLDGTTTLVRRGTVDTKSWVRIQSALDEAYGRFMSLVCSFSPKKEEINFILITCYSLI